MAPRLLKVAELLGHTLMPWQRQIADVGLEVDSATGLPAYREIVVTVMRQSGKSILLLSFQLDRCLSWPGLRRCAYTAQSGFDARKKLLRDYVPILEGSRLWPAVRHVRQSQGDEGLTFTDSSEIAVLASNLSAGHGRSWDLGVIDEAFDDEDDRREQSIVPALATKADGQLLVASTAGTARSTYLRRKVDAGRLAADLDSGSGIAYFEWSVPDDADVDDPETWWRYMPALGWTITPEAVAHARLSMSDGEFRRSFCNQWVISAEAWFTPELWASLAEPSRSIPNGAEVVLAFDGSFSGDSTGLTVHTVSGPSHIDVVGLWERPLDAIDWQVDQDEVERTLREAFQRWQVRHCVYDPRIWQQLMQRLAAEGYPMEPMPQGQAMIAAAQRFFEDAANKRFTQSGDARLARHVAHCVVKPTSQGPRVQKETPKSPLKIDLAICAVMGHAYASQVEAPIPRSRIW